LDYIRPDRQLQAGRQHARPLPGPGQAGKKGRVLRAAYEGDAYLNGLSIIKTANNLDIINDTPKIVALLLASSTVLPASASLVLVAGSMAVGGWLSARRVAETLSRKITSLNPGQGLTANLTTAFLVTCASRWGLPVSTTHVAVGALCGIGWRTGSGHLRTILTILTAWVTTLPLGMGLGAAVLFLLNNLYG
jgi:phosphate/sulfate permease